ncbi:hypothetical protein KBD71_02105 [Candidatus Woesebacteria bacterium]|nr:hypothetical protein [Candidatus Woesebacteria bacterium]
MKRKVTIRSLLFEQQMLGVLLFSLLILFLWIGASIYFQYNQSTISTDETYPVEPISANLDTSSLLQVSNRRWWTDEELSSFPLSVELESEKGTTTPRTLSPTPSPQPTVATNSAQTTP